MARQKFYHLSQARVNGCAGVAIVLVRPQAISAALIPRPKIYSCRDFASAASECHIPCDLLLMALIICGRAGYFASLCVFALVYDNQQTAGRARVHSRGLSPECQVFVSIKMENLARPPTDTKSLAGYLR